MTNRASKIGGGHEPLTIGSIPRCELFAMFVVKIFRDYSGRYSSWRTWTNLIVATLKAKWYMLALAKKLIQITGNSLVILKTAGLICLLSLTLLLLTRPTSSSPMVDYGSILDYGVLDPSLRFFCRFVVAADHSRVVIWDSLTGKYESLCSWRKSSK